MTRTSWIVGGAALLTILSCGGGGAGNGTGQVSGIVTDVNGDPVRGALVFSGSRSTYSNSAGSYVLDNVSAGDILVRAEIEQDGIDFNGQNVARVFRDERTKSLNIAVVRTNLQARLHGRVRDRFGNRVEGARVYAEGNALTGNMAITNSNGDYSMGGLMAGVTYQLTATARQFDSDLDSVNLSAGQDREMDFTLGDGSNPSMPEPENLFAIAWTTPAEISRDAELRAGLNAIKDMIEPRRKTLSSRTTVNGNNVEVNLFWDPYNDNYESLLGFGVYRATTANGASAAIDFVREPSAFFFQDLDDGLRENRNYYYEITALNVQYPDTFDSESDFSNRYGVETLADLILLNEILSPLTFRWQGGVADEYAVYLFEDYPGIGVNSIWSTESNPTNGNSQLYTGPPLVSGRRYYYVVLGLANGGDSRTLSFIADFVAN